MNYSRSDIIDVEYRLDKEGKEFHHYEDFAQMYRAEVFTLCVRYVQSKGMYII